MYIAYTFMQKYSTTTRSPVMKIVKKQQLTTKDKKLISVFYQTCQMEGAIEKNFGNRSPLWK